MGESKASSVHQRLGTGSRSQVTGATHKEAVRKPDRYLVHFANTRFELQQGLIDLEIALEKLTSINDKLQQWSTEALANDAAWQPARVTVTDSPRYWNGTVHTYANDFVWQTWMSYRNLCIYLSFLTERILKATILEKAEWDEKRSVLWSDRREMTNDICAAVPAVMPCPNSCEARVGSVFDAYNSIWPLYVAGVCLQDRIRNQVLDQHSYEFFQHTSAVSAQYSWVQENLKQISERYRIALASELLQALVKESPVISF